MHNEQLVAIFLEESADLLEELEQGLVQLEERSNDRELVNGVFRAAHSIKGGAGAVNYEALVTLTHTAENVLSRVRERELDVTKPLVDLLLTAVDKIRGLVDDLAAGSPNTIDSETQKLLANLARYAGVSGAAPVEEAPEEAPSPVEALWGIHMAFEPTLMTTGQDPLLLFEDLAEVGSLERVLVNMAQLPSLDELDPEQFYLGWDVVLRSDKPQDAVNNVFLFVADDNEIEVAPLGDDASSSDFADLRIGDLLVDHGHVSADDVKQVLEQQKLAGQLLVEQGKVPGTVVEEIANRQSQAREARRQAAIRVDTEKLDGLLNTVGEMVINIARATELLRKSHDEEAQTTADSLENLSRELQEQAMGLRMVSIEPTFSRFKRTVRDLASELGKEVKLEITGGETELDKNVIESIADPLKHLIRNAVHHGLELPDAREAEGKPRAGTLRLAAEQREGSIFLEVGDDGGGINTEKVLAKARAQGLVAEGAELEDAQIHQLLFEAGFSTADEVNEISGRGVGLDVVRKNIEQLRGEVSVLSKRGEGTTFRIRLPLTLAIVDGMTVRIGEEVLTVPLLSVIEQLRPAAKDLKTVEGTGELVGVRGEFVPLLRLDSALSLPGGQQDPEKGLVMIIEGAGRRFAMLVDEVLGQVQAVVKSLDRNYHNLPGISGATILGDGRVSLILDVHSIEKVAREKAMAGDGWRASFSN